MREGQIPPEDRMNTEMIQDKIDKVYDDLGKLEQEKIRILCAYLLTVHNNWNWENLLKELLTIKHK